MLTGGIKSINDLPEGSAIRYHPRFQPDTFPINMELVKEVQNIAQRKGVTPAQLAVNWVRSLSKQKGKPSTIIPIPGSTTASRLAENAKVVDLTSEEMAEIDSVLKKFEVVGARYPDGAPIKG
jgi:pyridoxine 4-dehydrogenase